jgi:periplasmic copper chaperone A
MPEGNNMRTIALLPVIVALASFGPLAQAHEAEPGYRKGQIHAIQAWARINPVKGRPGAVFFTLHNESRIADSLVKVSTPIAKRAELHGHTQSKDGVMKMVPLQTVPVPADEMVLFEPDSNHVMLFDMLRMPKSGETFPLTLTFAKGKPQTIMVKAKGLATPQEKPVMEHMHH